MTSLIDALRDRKDELNLSHEALDALAGFASGYTSKLLAPEPKRGISHMSLTAILGALGVGLVLVEDAVQRATVEDRWQPRKRTWRPKSAGTLLAIENNPTVPSTNGDTDVQAAFEFPGGSRGCRPDQGGSES